jgi:soluble lytic murein transglycosylase-like protein
MRFLFVLIAIAYSASFAWAGEYVIFASGSRMRIDRHEIQDSIAHLYSGSTHTELNLSQIAGFEVDEIVTAPPTPRQQEQAPVQAAKPVPTPQELADAAADRYGLERNLVRSVMAAESAFQPHAVSPKGAVGLMQLMPSTAQEMGANPRDPVQNVDAGVRYLCDLLNKYDGRLWHALAAYNAGPGAVQKYNGIPPYPETIDYINRISKSLKN